MWTRIVNTVTAEFAEAADVEGVTRIFLRLFMAALLGGALGHQRQQRGKAAGVRTHILVAMGAALFVMVPEQGGMLPADVSRVVQGIVAGIGFLCAGAILKSQSDDSVRGLTTAAGLWMTAAIGVACGLGREATALLSATLALGVLMLVLRAPEGKPS